MASNPQGSEHWCVQRFTAIALLPLSLWFLGSLLITSPTDYAAIVEWLKSPFTTTGLVLFIGLLLYHGQLGAQVVLEDYIHCSALRISLIYGLKALALSLFIFAFLCVIKIHFHPL